MQIYKVKKNQFVNDRGDITLKTTFVRQARLSDYIEYREVKDLIDDDVYAGEWKLDHEPKDGDYYSISFEVSYPHYYADGNYGDYELILDKLDYDPKKNKKLKEVKKDENNRRI